MGLGKAIARAVKTAFTQPEERPRGTYMGYKPNENDGGVWARCGVHGDLSRHRNEIAAFEAEQAHWNTHHV